jgi:hypothetical protein
MKTLTIERRFHKNNDAQDDPSSLQTQQAILTIIQTDARCLCRTTKWGGHSAIAEPARESPTDCNPKFCVQNSGTRNQCGEILEEKLRKLQADPLTIFHSNLINRHLDSSK